MGFLIGLLVAYVLLYSSNASTGTLRQIDEYLIDKRLKVVNFYITVHQNNGTDRYILEAFQGDDEERTYFYELSSKQYRDLSNRRECKNFVVCSSGEEENEVFYLKALDVA